MENRQAIVDLTSLTCAQIPPEGRSPVNALAHESSQLGQSPSMENGFRVSARNDGCAAYGTLASQTKVQFEKAMIEF